MAAFFSRRTQLWLIGVLVIHRILCEWPNCPVKCQIQNISNLITHSQIVLVSYHAIMGISMHDIICTIHALCATDIT